MTNSRRKALVTGARWAVLYTIAGAIVGYTFFSDDVYGIQVHTSTAKVLLGAGIGFGGTVFSVLIRHWLGGFETTERS